MDRNAGTGTGTGINTGNQTPMILDNIITSTVKPTITPSNSRNYLHSSSHEYTTPNTTPNTIPSLSPSTTHTTPQNPFIPRRRTRPPNPRQGSALRTPHALHLHLAPLRLHVPRHWDGKVAVPPSLGLLPAFKRDGTTQEQSSRPHRSYKSPQGRHRTNLPQSRSLPTLHQLCRQRQNPNPLR